MKKMYKIKNDLYNYVKKYNIMLEEKEVLISNNYIYEEILRILSDCISFDYSEIFSLSICLETLFGNKYNDLLDCLYFCSRLKVLNNDVEDEINKLNSRIIKFTKEIKNEYIESKSKYEKIIHLLDVNKDKMISARRVQTCLKYKQIIAKNDISNLNIILRELGYNNDEVAEIIEGIFVRNKNIVTKNKGIRFDASEKYKFLDLFSLGGEIFELPFVDEPLKLRKIADSIYNIFESYSGDDLLKNYVDVLPSIGKEVKDIDELEYVLINVLNKFRNSFDEKIELIKDPDFIMDLEIKNELASDCYKLIDYYNLIRNYLDEFLENNNILEDIIVDNLQENNYKISYLLSSFGKCYLLSDIKDMPMEYISKVKELLDNFKKDIIANKQNKMLQYRSDFSELKGDQIRIIYKRLNNNYLFYGAFIKKDDWKYRVDFKRVIGRVGIISENPLEIETEINEYINEHQRKWSR